MVHSKDTQFRTATSKDYINIITSFWIKLIIGEKTGQATIERSKLLK